MRKKIVALSLVAIMMSVLTGCGNGVLVKETDIQPVETAIAPSGSQPVETGTTSSESYNKKSTNQSSTVTQTSEPDTVNLLETMSHGEKTELNQFLSNFSEAYYNDAIYYSEDEGKISFAFIHSALNRKNTTIKYEGSYEGISAQEVDTILNRFFGKSVPHKTPENNLYITYKDGYFWKMAGDGETYSFFSIATDLREHTDGNFIAKFSVFHDGENPHDMLQSWYSLTYDEAENDPRYSHSYDGEAILKKKNGTYEVVSYNKYFE